MTETKTPRPPAGTCPEGRKLWAAVLADFELAEHELCVLRQAVGCLDVIAALTESAAQRGLTTPVARELRGQRIALARLISALRLPQGEEGDQQASARPQRRTGTRGVYALRSTS